MSSLKGLSHKKLRNEFNPKELPFTDTSKIEPLYGIIGQDRAVKALEFGINIKTRGYNIYLSGMTGTGKTSYAQNFLKKIAAKEKVPDDWCYVYNFDKPNEPTSLKLPAGKGKEFVKDMEDFVKVLQFEISKAFDSEDYEREKSTIVKEFQSKRKKLIDKLNKDAQKQGFKVKTTNTGIYFLPVIEGKTINEQEYGDLDDEIKNQISEKSDAIQIETIDIIRKIKGIEKEAEEKVGEWENKVALFAVGVHINDLKDKYKKYPRIIKYLDRVQEDILDNLDYFVEDDLQEEQQHIMLPFLKNGEETPEDKYSVNLLVDNSGLKGAPVIVDFNPTYYNLVGKLEYENEFGSVTTDFSMIKCGLFHQANGGYLILQAKDILSNVQAWEALKRVLRTRQITVENMKEQMGLVAMSTLKPEPIPLDMKVLLVGNELIYQLLYHYDEDFRKLFKIKADFDEDMERTPDNIMQLAKFISSFCEREKTIHFHRTAVAKIIEYSSRLLEDQTKLSTKFNDIVEILSESCVWAKIAGHRLVKAEDVDKAVKERVYRSNKYDKRLLELLKDGTIMVDTGGEVVGQINGLTILDTGDYSFGKPTRITATTFMGGKGIVNIEREIEMSGTSHSKGVLILSGYIGQKYAQEMPLSLTASLCFEQMYGGIDGDSASSAELYAILSSLSGIPIKQCIGVTGSVNQKGEIQPIGGATEKIEGFFELCKYRGLTGREGVIIPYLNIKNLVLNDEVTYAVKEGKFNIYAVKTIDEGVEILTGMKAGEKRPDGTYRKGTINYLVYEKLKDYAMTVASFGKQALKKMNNSKKHRK